MSAWRLSFLGAVGLAIAGCDLGVGSGGGMGAAPTVLAPHEGGAGGGGVCAPGESVSCYEGPPSTEGVGVCHAGTRTCAADGSGFGPCTGQTLPSPEDCGTPEDDDCDGTAPPCSGSCLWSSALGGVNARTPGATAVSPEGDILVDFTFADATEMGGMTLDSQGALGVALARLDANGHVQWAESVCDIPLYDEVDYPLLHPSFAPNGSIVVTADRSQPLHVGGHVVPVPAEISLAPDGSFLHGTSFLSDVYLGFVDIQSSTVDALGRILVFAQVTNAFSFLGASYPPDTGALFVFDSSGVPQFAVGIGAWLTRGRVVTGADGTIVLSGGFGPTATVAAFDSMGAPRFTRALGPSSEVDVSGLDIDPLGDIVVGGYVLGAHDLGAGPIGQDPYASVFVAKLAPSGDVRWSRGFVDAYPTPFVDHGVTSVAVAPQGRIGVASSYWGTLDFGAGPVTAATESEVFALMLEGDGSLAWGRTFGGPIRPDRIEAHVDAAGRMILVGQGFGTMDFGCGPIDAWTDGAVFIASLSP